MRRSNVSLCALALLSTSVALGGCISAEPLDEQDTETHPTTSGILSVAIAGKDVHYALKQPDGTYAQLDLSHLREASGGDADGSFVWRTAGGSPVDVFGERREDGSIRVDTLAPSASVTTSESALVTTGTRRILVLNVSFDGKGAVGTNKDLENMMAEAAAHFEASSYGKMKIAYDVAGPFNVSFGSCNDTYRWTVEAQRAAQQAGKDISTFQHFALFGKMNCGYSGAGELPGSFTWNALITPVLMIHGIGHNLGLLHASSRTCTNASGAVVTMSDTCVFDEYGDPFDPMGLGTAHQYNASYKLDLGWLSSANVKTITSDQTVTLAPLSVKSSGLQMLRVKGPKDVVYTVEFRQPAATDKFDPGSTATSGVLVHALYTQAPDADKSYLLDMNPGGDFNDAALTVGKSYTFFGTKAKMTVLSASPAGAKVEISGLGNGSGPDTSDRLQVVSSRKCLSIQGGSAASGALAVQRACSGSGDQEWQLTSASGGALTLKNVNSGKCLEVQGASKSDGAKIEQGDCKGSASQTWKQIKNADGTIALSSASSGKCLDVYRASTADSAPFVLWDCHDATNQQFRRQ